MFKTLISIVVVSFLFIHNLNAQTDQVVGLRENTPAVFALTNATVVTEPGNVTNNATIVVRDGIIEDAGRRVSVPEDATVIDLEGKRVYPGFIDMYSDAGMPDLGSPPQATAFQDIPEEYMEMLQGIMREEVTEDAGRLAAHWNPQVRSFYRSTDVFRPDRDAASVMRSQGFVMANIVPKHGIFRGYSTVASLGNDDAGNLIVNEDVAQVLSFSPSRELGGRYPTSLMGVVALMRQAFYDADWYDRAHEAYRQESGLEQPEVNISLASLADAVFKEVPFIADASDEIAFLRAHDISKEFALNMWMLGSGDEYKRIDAISQTGMPVIVPLDFRQAPSVEKPEETMNTSLSQLREWYLEPENPARLVEAGVPVTFTSNGLRNKGDFLNRLRTSVKRGLCEEEALKALTVTPAEMLGVDYKYGSIGEGKAASLVIADGNIFDENTSIRQVWVDGNKHVIEDEKDVSGKYRVEGEDILRNAVIEIKGSPARLSGSLTLDQESVDLASVSFDNQRMSFRFKGEDLGFEGNVRMSANYSEGELMGIGEKGDGTIFNWTAERTEEITKEEEERERREAPDLTLEPLYPQVEYGIREKPEQPSYVVVQNATIWTQGPEGKMENADILISEGRIEEVGRDISVPRRAEVIDGTGKHVTPGLIDPHLHSAIAGGVNETGYNMTAEVRIEDVIHPNTVWMYRLLAGGLTTAKLFHGSANPVGGQDAVIKMRWGGLPDEVLFEGAKPGLKMALGENVVRRSGQYPNTRMGAEQIIKDGFLAAEEYGKRLQEWEDDPSGIPPRRDLQLEALLEVLEGERKVHVHAYRQDEMLMMMRLAEEFDFTVGTFEHGLEGYKIADEIREHGAIPVVWSDWQSFKVEAYDGILHNAKLLNDAGVVTSLHSDNTQIATRMNWEAGKVVRTGLSQEDALDMITKHPAIALGVEDRVGTLESGKDADFVIWSGEPLSSFSIAEQTWVDGRKYFDREEDKERREEVKEERLKLIEHLLENRN